MLQRLKRKLSKIKMLAVLIPLTLFIAGCGSKPIAIQAQKVERLEIKKMINVNKPYFNRSANDDVSASLMLWDLYAYIKELENALDACVELESK